MARYSVKQRGIFTFPFLQLIRDDRFFFSGTGNTLQMLKISVSVLYRQ